MHIWWQISVFVSVCLRVHTHQGCPLAPLSCRVGAKQGLSCWCWSCWYCWCYCAFLMHIHPESELLSLLTSPPCPYLVKPVVEKSPSKLTIVSQSLWSKLSAKLCNESLSPCAITFYPHDSYLCFFFSPSFLLSFFSLPLSPGPVHVEERSCSTVVGLMASSFRGAALAGRKVSNTCQLVTAQWLQHIPALCICREKWITWRVCSTKLWTNKSSQVVF